MTKIFLENMYSFHIFSNRVHEIELHDYGGYKWKLVTPEKFSLVLYYDSREHFECFFNSLLKNNLFIKTENKRYPKNGYFGLLLGYECEIITNFKEN